MIVFAQNVLINSIIRVMLVVGEMIVFMTPNNTDNTLWRFIKKVLKAYLGR